MSAALLAFVEARLAEDYRHAFLASQAGGDTWTAERTRYSPVVRTGDDAEPEWTRQAEDAMWDCDDPEDECATIAGGWMSEAEHIARHDPARVLRDVDSTRAVLAAFERSRSARQGPETAGQDLGLEEAVELIATRWSNHPDFRAEWRR